MRHSRIGEIPRISKHYTGQTADQVAAHWHYKSKCLLMTWLLPKCLSLSNSAAVAAASARTSAFAGALLHAVGHTTVTAENNNATRLPGCC